MERIYKTQNYSNSTEQNKYQSFASKVITLINDTHFLKQTQITTLQSPKYSLY